MFKNVRLFQVAAMFTFCLFMAIMAMVFYVSKLEKRGVTRADVVELQLKRYREEVSHGTVKEGRVSWQHVNQEKLSSN